jgi:hypothetical protein
MTVRERLHQIVDELAEPDAERALRALERWREEPVALALAAAPPDEEPVTDADRDALAEAWEDVRAGRVHTVDEAFGSESGA